MYVSTLVSACTRAGDAREHVGGGVYAHVVVGVGDARKYVGIACSRAGNAREHTLVSACSMQAW